MSITYHQNMHLWLEVINSQWSYDKWSHVNLEGHMI